MTQANVSSNKKQNSIQVSNSLARYYSEEARKYAERAEAAALSAEKNAGTIISRLDTLDTVIEDAKQDVLNTVSLAKQDLDDRVTELLGGIDEELKQLIGEE